MVSICVPRVAVVAMRISGRAAKVWMSISSSPEAKAFSCAYLGIPNASLPCCARPPCRLARLLVHPAYERAMCMASNSNGAEQATRTCGLLSRPTDAQDHVAPADPINAFAQEPEAEGNHCP